MANMLRYIGPAFVVGVAFMEPGNWVSLLEGGSRFGYELAWAVVISILLAMLFQTISARLGVVTGKDFAQVCREEFPSAVCVLLWGLCEISIITSDLTMVLGTAVALNVVFRMPALPSIVLMAVDSLLFMLLLPLLEMKRAVVMTVVVSGVIVLCFFVDNVVNGTAPLSMAVGLLPRIKHETLYATISIIGAHVLPQNFYLNSSLVKDLSKTSTSLSSLLNHYLAGTVSAFSAVLVVNLAILGVAVAAFHNAGLVVVTLLDAQALIEQILNSTLCPSVFGLTLLYAGQLSTLNSGTAGQVVSEGFFDYKIYPWQHRILIRGIALVPLATWSWRYGSEGIYQLLVFSQVLLALNLPFTVVPLIKVTSSERIMGSFKNSFFLETSAWLFLGVMSAANVTLVFDLVFGDDGFGGFEFDVGLEWFFEMTGENGQTLVVGAISVVTTLALGFLVWLIFTPLQLDSQVPARYLWIEDYAKQDEIVGWGSANLVAKPIASETVGDPVPVPVPIPVAVPVPVPISIKVPVHVPVPAILDTDAADLKDDEPDILVGELPALGVSPEVDIKLSELESSADAGESLVSVQTQNHLELESHNDRKDSNAPAEGTHSTPPRVSRISPETSIDSTPPVAPSLPSTVSNNDTVDVGTSTAVEDIEVTALKNAEAEADAETAEVAEKDDDEGNSWTGPKDVQAEGPSSVSNVNDSVRSLHCDGPESLGKGDPNTASSVEPVEGGSGSGSLSRLSGLGRAARRQFALILDEFWTNLFDLHGQPVTSRWKGSQGGSRGNQQDGNLRGGVSSPKDAVDSQYSNLSKQQKAHLLHMRNHAAASMVASQSSFQQPQDYMATSPTYRNERRYSSLHIPPRQEELDYQPATIHGYKLSQMSGRSGLGLRPYQADASHYRSPRDYQTLGLQSDAEMDAADLCRGSAYDYGNQPLLSSQWVLNVVGNRRPTDLKGRSDGFVGKADEQYLDQFDGVNRVSSSPSTQWDPLVFRSRDSPLGRWNPLVYRATGELDMKDGSLGVPRDFPHQQSSLGHSPIGRGSHGGDAERAPLVFDELSPSQSHRDAFSIQTSLPRAETQSLWARQPFEQLFGATDSEGGVAAQTSGQFKRVSSQMPKSSASGPVSASDAAEFELDVLEKLQTCVQKLFCLEGADWLFRSDNGADEELVTAIAVTLRAAAEGDKKEQHNFSGAYGNHEHHHSQLENNYSRSNLRRGGSHSNAVVSRRSPYNSVRNCGEGCVWDGSLLISFGVWCVHRILELSLMESRPELWGKYTYVLNRLQGILEPAFSKQRVVPGFCRCINESALDARKRRASILKQGSYGSGDFGSSLSVPSLPNPWPWGRNTTCVKGKSLSATVFVDMIKEVEIAVGSRKGRTGTAAGDVAFPKGKENLASVLKRYKRRLLNKPPGSTSVGGGGRRV